jgi:hypothetical protein
MVFCESNNTGLIMKKAFTDVEDDDLEGFPNEEISKSKILGVVCATRSFKKHR